MVYRPYPRRLESLNVCRCLYKGRTFSSVVQRPWVLVRQGLKPAACSLADRHLSNWANRAAVNQKHTVCRDKASLPHRLMHFLDNSWKLTLWLILLRAYLEVLGSCGSSSVTWILSVRLWTNALNRAERPSFPWTSSLKSWRINYAPFHKNAQKQKGATIVMQNQPTA